ncbi:MAG: c-type cytochrome [Polynucleobacter sp.]|jgi:cytochrome c553|nr:c-type cytochrome [Polynucleobacter sp.]
MMKPSLPAIASLTGALFILFAGSTQAANADKGKDLVEKNNCAACHGAGLKAPVAPAYPKIAGQYEDYVYNALRSYQVKNNASFGRNNAIMASQVEKFKDQELRDMAAYIASLSGDLVVKR